MRIISFPTFRDSSYLQIFTNAFETMQFYSWILASIYANLSQAPNIDSQTMQDAKTSYLLRAPSVENIRVD